MKEKELESGIKEWINHSNHTNGRSKSDLVHYQIMWDFFRSIYYSFSNDQDYEKKQFSEKMIYKGKLYRIHRYYKSKEYMFGINESIFYQSWRKDINFLDLYWINTNTKYLLIEAESDGSNIALDLSNLADLLEFQLGMPGIIAEKEVVFPILYKDFIKVSVVEFDKNRNIKTHLVVYNKS